MEGLTATLTIVIGMLLRIGLPIALTALVIYFLRKMDNRWKAEASQRLLVPVLPRTTPCWEVKHCKPEQMKSCPAANQTVRPCWQIFRSAQGILRETCLGCEVFTQAPLAAGD